MSNTPCPLSGWAGASYIDFPLLLEQCQSVDQIHHYFLHDLQILARRHAADIVSFVFLDGTTMTYEWFIPQFLVL
jgi:hypothetical protein